jgi:hypothetical protein
MIKRNEDERLKRFHVVLSLDDTAWLDRLAKKLLAGGTVRVSRSEIIRGALATLRELCQAAPECPAIRGVVVELEHNIIRESVIAALDQAQRDGTKSGRAVGRPRVVIDVGQLVELRDSGLSWRETARRLRATVGTARRAYKAATEGRQVCKNPLAEAV